MGYAQHTSIFKLLLTMIIMAEKQKLRAPTGIAGLVKYEDEGESLIKLKPVHVVGIAVGLIVLEIILFLIMPL